VHGPRGGKTVKPQARITKGLLSGKEGRKSMRAKRDKVNE
jgi:hypothetical protein